MILLLSGLLHVPTAEALTEQQLSTRAGDEEAAAAAAAA